MEAKIHRYPIIIKETLLDLYGHVNNAAYLTLYEEARWDMITKSGYGLHTIRETGLGPVILNIDISYLKELRSREEIVVESQTLSYEKKVGVLQQVMLRDGEVCNKAIYKFGLFDLKNRKLVIPTQEWLIAIGVVDVETLA